MSSPHDHNRRAWDRLVRQGQRFTLPATEQHFKDPLKALDSFGWLDGDVRGKKMLCLAAGGGKHSVLYASAGAEVTVIDISPAMLELDRQIAEENRLNIRIIEASMDDLSMLEDEYFDVVIHPVSTCYLPNIADVYREVARVIHQGGLYISQHKQPASLQATSDHLPHGYALKEPYYREGPLPPGHAHSTLREHGTQEYLHRWEQLIGELCRSGFVVEDLAEPNHANHVEPPGQPGHRGCYIAPYVCIKARRLHGTVSSGNREVWVP